MLPGDIYFASFEPYSNKYLEALLEKINIYRTYITSSGKIAKWQRSLQNYYGLSSDGTKSSNQITRGGEHGQLVMGKVNDYRNLIQHQLILITNQRPAGQAKAINSDTKSLHQARIGSLLTEYYLSQIGWEKQFVRGAEISLIADESFHVLEWDATSGDPIRPNPETGKMLVTGDSKLRVVCPWNMARDPYMQNPDDMTWGIYNYRENKFNLAANYPQFENEIINGGTRKVKEIIFDRMEDKDTDFTNIYCLSHNPSPSVPNGRLTIFVSEAILFDGDFPYSEFNIYRECQNDIVDTCFGYSNNNDLLALEEVTDALHSIVITNQTTTGLTAIVSPKGANINHLDVVKGLPWFEIDPAYIDKVRALQLTHTAPEIFNYLEMLSRKKETLAGINSVVRGDPEGALRSNSGSALALVQAQSIQFNSGGQRSYYHILSKVNTGHIKLLQRYATNERVIRIAGKVQSQYINEFKYTNEDLENISSVVFEAVDPSYQAMGGKVAAADNLLDKGMVKNARQYLTVVRTGSLDAFTEDDEADELAIKSENERLRDGKPVSVLITENHEEHIQGHMSVIASPESKQDEDLKIATLHHIQEHVDLWQQLSQTNPALLIATKQKVLPPVPTPQPGGPLPMGEPGGAINIPEAASGNPPVVRQAQGVQIPKMPVNLISGQRVPEPGPQT